ncbi:MAG: hypothetical protein EPO26_14610 [Chloroflexota bacterium]|nr:MAG: hypothetical protein EPO26_14610 [Chloroflexota bacterium]
MRPPRYAALSIVGDRDRHPNEDAWAIGVGGETYAVCDGVTTSHLPDGRYPSWAGGGVAAHVAADELVSLDSSPPGARHASPRQHIIAALARADALVAGLNANRDDGPIDFDLHDAYSTTAVVANLADGRVHVACLGDAAAILAPAHAPPYPLTRFQTDAAEAIRDILLADGREPRERASLFRRELRNRPSAWRNRAGVGYGVLDGTGRYRPMIEWRQAPIGRGDRLYIATDAVGRCLADRIERGEPLPTAPEEVIAVTRAWERRTRAAYQDDATVLIVSL